MADKHGKMQQYLKQLHWESEDLSFSTAELFLKNDVPVVGIAKGEFPAGKRPGIDIHLVMVSYIT